MTGAVRPHTRSLSPSPYTHQDELSSGTHLEIVELCVDVRNVFLHESRELVDRVGRVVKHVVLSNHCDTSIRPPTHTRTRQCRVPSAHVTQSRNHATPHATARRHVRWVSCCRRLDAWYTSFEMSDAAALNSAFSCSGLRAIALCSNARRAMRVAACDRI